MPNLMRLKCQKGQGLVEYILVVALMGIFLIATVRALANRTKTAFTKAGNEIANVD